MSKYDADIADEKKAHKHYSTMAKDNPRYGKTYRKMSKQEGQHKEHLEEMKHEDKEKKAKKKRKVAKGTMREPKE